jgi:predicted O-linked N-acetylglucosamine transferase (SPINDLY family)
MSDTLFQNARFAHEMGDLDAAERMYGEILRANAKHFDALYQLGLVHLDRGGLDQAHRLLGEAAKIQPQSADAHFARGRALQRLNRHGQALEAFDQALAIDPNRAEIVARRAASLLGLRRYRDTIAAYDGYLALHPDHAEGWHNRGIALAELKRHEEALQSFGKALALRPDSAVTWANRGNTNLEIERFEDAAHDFREGLAIDPDLPFARGYLVLSRLHDADWAGLADERAKISSGLRVGKRVIVPFGNMVVSTSVGEQSQSARIWMEGRFGTPSPLWHGERYGHERIRVAYLSGDFRTHPVGMLMAGVFEHHDRTRFETIGISFGPDDASEIRARVASGVERFIDARIKSDLEVASLLRDLETDIAVDLMGLTADCRPGILACRPAPVQVNYLGYPGSMAAAHMNYILADRIVIPEDEKKYYAEQVVYLPDTYLATDSSRRIAQCVASRAELGLPERGFVFASFNNAYKFSPEMFAIWMRLLGAIEGSVLWLPQGREAGERNLKREAEAAGIDATRLVFAPRLSSAEEHLARLSVADLFLDTLPSNAQTTATDALWAGLPVLTCMGGTFVGRIAASLLNAVGLPELITRSLADYEALALALARDTGRLSAIKTKLAKNRTTTALFDTARFTRHLESAFRTMRDQSERGLPPQSFAVEPAP